MILGVDAGGSGADFQVSYRGNTGVPSPHDEHDADIPWYFWFLTPIGEAVTQIVVAAISDSIADSLKSDLSINVEGIPTQSVHWTGAGQDMKITLAGLNTCFNMQGIV